MTSGLKLWGRWGLQFTHILGLDVFGGWGLDPIVLNGSESCSW